MSGNSETTDHIDNERTHAEQQHDSSDHPVSFRECVDSQGGERLRCKPGVSEAWPQQMYSQLAHLPAGPSNVNTSRVYMCHMRVVQLLRCTTSEVHVMEWLPRQMVTSIGNKS